MKKRQNGGKRRLLATVLAATMMVGVLLTGCGSGSSGEETAASAGTAKSSAAAASTVDTSKARSVRIAYQPAFNDTTLQVAMVNGFLDEEFQKINVKPAFTEFESGPPMNEAFAAGEQDIGYCGDVPTILAKASGQNTEIIASAGYNRKTCAVIVPANSNLNEVADLKGKSVAFVKGSISQDLISALLGQQGLTLNDIQQVNLAHGDIVAAVANGEVDAGSVWEPALSRGVNDGLVKVLADGSTGDAKMNVGYYFANADFVKENPDIIVAFIKGIQDAVEYLAKDPEGAADSIKDISKCTVEETVAVFENFDFSPRIDDNILNELRRVEQFTRDEGLSTNQVDIDSFVNTEYLTEAGIQ